MTLTRFVPAGLVKTVTPTAVKASSLFRTDPSTASRLGAILAVAAVLLAVLFSLFAPPTLPLSKEATFFGSQRAAISKADEIIDAAFDASSDTRFVTDAPDGEAYIGLTVKETAHASFASISAQPGQWERYIANAAVLEGEAGDGSWTTVGTLSRTAYETLEWRRDGRVEPFQRFRIRILDSGDAPEVIIASAVFKFDAKNPIDQLITLPVQNAIILCIAFLSFFFLQQTKGQPASLSFPLFLCVVCYFLLAYNQNLFVLNKYWPVFSADSYSYLFSKDAIRPPGVGAFLKTLNFSNDYKSSVLIQLNILLLSIAFVFYTVGRVLNGYWIALIGLIAVASHGVIANYGLILMSEASFMSAMHFGLGFLLLALSPHSNDRQRSVFWIAAGVALALSIAVKPIGPALVLAIIWTACLVRPFSKARLAAVTVPAVFTYLAVCSWNFFQVGKFTLSTLGPIAMAAYVGWWLEPDATAEHPKFVQDMSTEISALQDEWPEDLKWPFEIAHKQAKTYNTVAWRRLIPAAKAELERQGKPYSREEANKIIGSMAKTAITQCIECYAALVITHYLYSWNLLERDMGDVEASATKNLLLIQTRVIPAGQSNEKLAPVYQSLNYNLPETKDALRRWYAPTLPPRAAHTLAEEIKKYAVWPVMIVSLIAALIGVVGLFSRRALSAPVLALIAASLLLNAFFGAQSLAQVALVRYSFTGFPLFWVVLCLAVGTGLALVRVRPAKGRVAL